MISFAEKHPDLIPEWSDKNSLEPNNISYGSNKKVLWRGVCGHEWKAIVKNRGNGHGCPYCSGNKVMKGFNDLAFHYPELTKEWSDLNYPHKPEEFTKRSTHHAWWKCSACGHQWKARIADRAEGHGCPVCAGERLVPEINSLAAVKPELVEEWSPKNPKRPEYVWPGSEEMVWWICKKCGFEWKAKIRDRFKGKKCPACEDLRVHPGFNSLAAREPWILKEWDYEKNGDLLPTQILHNSKRLVWWKDEKGHSWKAKISDRLLGAGYPACEREQRTVVSLELIQYYSEKVGLYFTLFDDSKIGVPLQIYYPKLSAAIIFSPGGHRQALKWEKAVNWLCINAGVRLIRILAPTDKEYDNCICITRADDSVEAMNLAISTAFCLLGVEGYGER